MTAWYACDDCGTAIHERASLCIECHRARVELADERDREWWA